MARSRFPLLSVAYVITLLSCIQPTDPSVALTENLDTTKPITPSASGTAIESHDLGAGLVDFYNTPTPTVTFNLSNATVPSRYRVSASPWVGPNPVQITEFTPATPLTDGSYLLEVQEREDSGNWSDSFEYPFIVDTVPPAAPVPSGNTPSITANLTPRFFWFGDSSGGSRRFSGTIDGPGIQTQPVSLDFSALAAGTEFSSAPATFSGSGTATLSLTERDYAGNLSGPSVITVTIDVDGPGFTAQPTSPTNQATNHLWSWNSSGAANADEVYWFELLNSATQLVIDSGTLSGASVTYTNSTPLADGPYLLRVRERRNGGTDWSLWVDSGQLLVDTTPPGVPTFGVIPAALGTENNPLVTWGAGEPGATFTYSLTGPSPIGATTTAGTSVQLQGLNDGQYTFALFQTDTAGNDSGVATHNFVVDTTAPAVPTALTVSGLTGTAPNAYTAAATPTYGWTPGGGGNGQFQMSLNGGATTTAVNGVSFALATARGRHSFVVRERDAAGNWSGWSAPVSFAAQPRFLAEVVLHLDIGTAATGLTILEIQAAGTTRAQAQLDNAVNAGATWYHFAFGNVPIIPGETVRLLVTKPTGHDFANNNYAFWSASPIGTDPYPAGAASVTGDWAFETYVRDAPALQATLDASHPDTSYGYFTDATARWQDVVVGP